jgi:transcription termination factor Rho
MDMKMADDPGSAGSVENGTVEGILELDPQGNGFLRSLARHLNVRGDDPWVSVDAVRKFSLRGGELLSGPAHRVEKGNRRYKLARIDRINGVAAAEWQAPPPLADTTAIDPFESLRFETPGGPLTMRIVDLFAPIGRGQRGLIVAPPRTGKTILLQQMAHGVAVNHPDVYMIVLLIDERPEEVTELRRNVRGEVIASSNDQDVNSHIRVARLVMERARRLAERGQHIVILLDSITRLARAFNNFVGSSGRTMTGGLDIKALQEPKQFFGAARRIEHGGSLTIIASALVETGSRADDFIFQEFKGTGNMEPRAGQPAHLARDEPGRVGDAQGRKAAVGRHAEESFADSPTATRPAPGPPDDDAARAPQAVPQQRRVPRQPAQLMTAIQLIQRSSGGSAARRCARVGSFSSRG